MPISPADDLLAHQTAETFDSVFTSDRNFYDRYYFNMHPSSDELFLVTGMGQYPNLGVTDAFVSISHRDTLYVVRASRELGANRLDTSVGPFRVEVVEGGAVGIPPEGPLDRAPHDSVHLGQGASPGDLPDGDVELPRRHEVHRGGCPQGFLGEHHRVRPDQADPQARVGLA